MTLQGRHVVVALGGGIAAFKAVALVRELIGRGAEVRVLMTEAATRFVGPITFAGLTGKPAITDLWAEDYAGEVHVELSSWADATVVAPATMNLMARAATGQADDVVLATLGCAAGNVFFAPAMHDRMWKHPATQANVQTLRSRGAVVLGPVIGRLASGEIGEGRMLEPEEIADRLELHLDQAEDLSGCKLIVTAGPTHEDLDPVRFLGNRSSGQMGYAIAARAARRGASVTLVSGPVSLDIPASVDAVHVRSALEMHQEVMSRAGAADVVIMAAAVADYRPAKTRAHKIKKAGELQVNLVRNPDILAELGAGRTEQPAVLVGFALETEDLEASAERKLRSKKADLIVANSAVDSLGRETNRAIFVDDHGATALPELSKPALADRILDWVGSFLKSRKRSDSKAHPAGEAPN